ncbi:hypothetical protein L1049_025189 [Liquidambar formosana]|uniref:Uncharacterized protein n=1 Tax=Liquidambar formosana TaxID=63359 RepID=A0AAP0X1S3_LIQFO
MAGWMLNNQKLNSKASEGSEMVMGYLGSQKSGVELMQNCDLPPPLKVFAGSDTTVITSMNRICSMMVREDDDGDDLHVSSRGRNENDKLELLKALRLSQTRAREAERKNEQIVKERDCLSNALLEESLKLFAHRRWVKLLEVQVSKLQSERLHRGKQSPCCQCCRSNGVESSPEEEDDGVKWVLALAVCLGIAGVGYAFGCRYLF